MTQTLDWHDVLGESAPASRPSTDRTCDWRSLLKRHDDDGGERWIVRNVVVMTGPDRARTSRSRAAFDLDRGTVIEVEPPAVGEGLDLNRLADSITAQLAMGSLKASVAAREASEPASKSGSSLDESAVAAAELIARRAFPAESRVEWSDDVDEEGVPYRLMRVASPGSPEEIHASYLTFMRSWVREVPPERRRSIRVALRASGSD